MKKLLILSIITGLFSGCAQDYYTTLSQNQQGTGTLIIRLTKPMRNVNITVNNKIVASGKHTKKIVINNVPADTAHVEVLGQEPDRNNLNESFNIYIPKNDRVEKLLQTPSLSGWWYVKTGIIITGTTAVSILLSPSQ